MKETSITKPEDTKPLIKKLGETKVRMLDFNKFPLRGFKTAIFYPNKHNLPRIQCFTKYGDEGR